MSNSKKQLTTQIWTALQFYESQMGTVRQVTKKTLPDESLEIPFNK